ncbi:MAG: hypothetical protein KA341_17395 [Saprospiraceae bacterium]|jgi:hypothetical protein|nr:hypothetical protein [Saprospiraceae bacterium]
MIKVLTNTIILLSSLGIFNSCAKKTMTIEELKIFTETDTVHISKQRVFIIDNFCNCPSDIFKFDSIVCSIIQDKSYNYSIGFFVKSDITNIENLEKFPKDFGIHSLQDDVAVHYKYFNHFPYFSRYDYYKDKVNMLEIERKLICKDSKAVEYNEKNK